MGYKRKRREIKVSFGADDGELHGLEAVTHGLPLGTYMDLVGYGEVDRSSLGEVLREFSQQLISWNLEEEDGTPVPATAEAVLAEDHRMMLKVATRWLDELSGAVKADPLEQTSPGGEPSLEASLPMEASPQASLAS